MLNLICKSILSINALLIIARSTCYLQSSGWLFFFFPVFCFYSVGRPMRPSVGSREKDLEEYMVLFHCCLISDTNFQPLPLVRKMTSLHGKSV